MASKRAMRPRLEAKERSGIRAAIELDENDFSNANVNLYQTFDEDKIVLSLADTKRLQVFLKRALAYLEQRKASGK
jgi:hypothetical protein